MKLKPYSHNKRFYNYPSESIKTYLKSIVTSAFHMFKKRKPFFSHHKEQAEWSMQPTFTSSNIDPTITWLGHATFLCQLGGYNIITDPVFGEISRLFPRMVPFPITPSLLPPVDVVLISHNHHDHLDKKSLKALQIHNPLFFVPYGDKKWFDTHGFSRVVEYSWWEQHTLPAKENTHPVTIQFLPAHHWSGRSIFGFNKSLWGSWLMSHGEKNIYFAGDTAYSKHFKIIGDVCKKIDIALLPIGPNEPQKGMHVSHINPEQALQALRDLNAQHFVPMHWGTFRQGDDTFLYAINKLTTLWNTTITESDKSLHIVKCGETKTIILKNDKNL